MLAGLRWHNSGPRMAPSKDGTDPSLAHTPVPLEGDGSELIGMVVDGRYRLDTTIGRGGMGLVYKATHVGMRRHVAVKILHPSLAASPDVKSRFEREALAVGKVVHPNCVATYDVGRLPDGALYLAMELLEGQSLADVLEREGQLAPGRALHILAHVLRGLGSIHAAGLIHRDIKPENIFLIRHGDDMDFAKILDFGIAKPMSGELSDDGVKLTQAGMAFGTPIYMAPEQALGNPMDGRADLYAAAVICYEMLCGQPPFYSEDKLEVMSMHTAKPVPLMRNRLIKGGKPVPSSIEKLILRGLTKKPRRPLCDGRDLPRDGRTRCTRLTAARPTSASKHPGRDTGSQPLLDDRGELNIGIDDAIDFAQGRARSEEVAARDTEPRYRAATRSGAGQHRRIPTTVGGVAPSPPVVAAAEPRGRKPTWRWGHRHRSAVYRPGRRADLRAHARAASTRPKRPQKWWLYGVIAALAIVIGVAIAVLTKPSTTKRLDRAACWPGERSARARRLRRRDPRSSRRRRRLESSGDPDAQLVLGHAYSAKNEPPQALSAYRRCRARVPDLESDKGICARTCARWPAARIRTSSRTRSTCGSVTRRTRPPPTCCSRR